MLKEHKLSVAAKCMTHCGMDRLDRNGITMMARGGEGLGVEVGQIVAGTLTHISW